MTLEGYKDPTADTAIANVMREQKQMRANQMMDLIDTVPFMASDNYNDRFKAEYMQLCIRINRLKAIVSQYDHLPYQPKSSKQLLRVQLEAMRSYKAVMEHRALAEGVDIKGLDDECR
jgi:hypothetical protein